MTARLDDIEALERLARRALIDLVSAQDLDDLCQEATARVLAVRDGVAPSAIATYTWIVARNVGHEHQRRERARLRSRARLAGRRSDEPGADEQADLWAHDRDAMNEALDSLSNKDRAVLGMRIVEELSTREVARRLDVTENTARARLHRAKGRLRVRYALARRDLTAPAACLRMLDVLVSRERAAQARVGLDDHLRSCPVCGLVAEDVLADRRPLAVLVPLAGVGAVRGAWQRLAGPTQAAVAASAAAASVAGVLVLTSQDRPPEAIPPAVTAPSATAATSSPPPSASQPLPALRTSDGRPLLPVPADLSALDGAGAIAARVPVVAVVGDEAFWVGGPGGDRILVVIRSSGESVPHVTTEVLVSFEAVIVAHAPGFAASVGVDAAEGAELADGHGAHLEVDALALAVSDR